MSYKTRPTAIFFENWKKWKNLPLIVDNYSPYFIFSCETEFFKRNDSLSYQPDIKTKTTTKVNSVFDFLFLLLISPLTNVPMMEFIWAFYFNS